MFYYFWLSFLLVLLIVVQSTLSSMLFQGFFILEISLIVIIYIGFRLDLFRGVILSFLVGLIMDCISGFILGLSSLVYVLIFLGSFFISEFLDTEKMYIVASFVFICALLKEILLLFFYSLVLNHNLWVDHYLTMFVQSVVAGLFAPAIFYCLRRLEVVFYENHP